MYKIDFAEREAAFLSNDESFDVAVLHRVRKEDLEDQEHKAVCLDDKQWQKVVSLVDAAPRMLAMLKRFRDSETISIEDTVDLIDDAEETFDQE